MNRAEYDELKLKILKDFGDPNPTYDEPNESRRRLNKLKSDYLVSCREIKRKEEKQALIASGKIEDLPELKPYIKNPITIGVIELNEKDLAAFTDQEREIIRQHFQDFNLSHHQLSHRVPKTHRQTVTALLDSPAYKILESRVFDRLMPSEVKIALLAATRDGDSKIIQRLAEHYRILQPEKMEIELNKPIEDPLAIKMLKDIGDKIIQDESNSKQNP